MPFPAGMGGTPLSGAPRFRLKRSDHRKAGSSGPRSAAARNKSSPVEIPFPIGGRFRIAGRSSTRKRPFLPGWRGRPCLERPVSGSSAQIIGRPDLPAHGQQPRETNPLQWKSPFPSGEGSALRGVRPPGNALFCQDGGDAPVWSAPFPAQALRSSEGRIFRPTVSSSAKQILSSGNPLSHRGKFHIAERSSTRKSPFMPEWRGHPCLGAPRFRLKRSDHRKAGSSGPRSAAARSKPTQWRSPRYWTSRRTCRSPCSSQSKYIRHLQPS